MILGYSGVRAGAAALVLCAVVVLLALGEPAEADTADDALLVFCLAPAQRGGLIDAGTALGVAQRGAAADTVLLDGKDTSPADWRTRRPTEFSRACKALSESQRPSTGTFVTAVLPFLTGLFGALLAFVAATWRDRVSRGRTLADNLRSAVVDFHDAAEPYLRSWAPGHSDRDVLARRRKLVTQLAMVKAAHRRWTKVHALQRDLTEGPLGGTMALEWTGNETDDREQVADLVRRLGDARDTVLQIAHALERPFVPHRSLRARRGGSA